MDKKKIVFPKTEDGKLDNKKFLEMMKPHLKEEKINEHYISSSAEAHLEDVFLKQMAETTINSIDDFQELNSRSAILIDEFGEIIGESTKITPEDIEVLKIYEKFDEMKSISSKYRKSRRWDWYLDYSKEFVEMANYLVDFTDDYNEFSPYKGRVNFQNMNNEQLRTYYTWRTNTRKFIYKKTDYNYILLYFNEVINNVGIFNYEKAIEMFLFIWNNYRNDYKQLDYEMPERIRDYFITYSTKETYEELISKYPIKINYLDENIRDILNSNYHNKFDYFTHLATYNIKMSKFYQDKQKDLFNSLIAYLFTKLDLLFKEKKYNLTNLIIKRDFTDYWKPFIGDSFFYHKDQFAKNVIISELETYDRQGASWHRESYSSISNNLFLGYVLKTMEAAMRKFYNFKYKLHPSVTSLITKNVFGNKKTFKFICSEELNSFIIETVNTFLNVIDVKSKTKKEIVFDSSKFAKIREVSNELAEKLIITEEEEIIIEKEDNNSFRKVEINILKMIINNELIINLNNYALKNGELLDLVIDNINAKCLNIIGDNLIDVNETITIFEDYYEEALKIIKEHE
ncbi:MAG TPA: hypothetical protein GX695_04330 [Acholeplasmataceae bacterium]|nr:hypothetical protein [Acholeplasmataceae bacterium]